MAPSRDRYRKLRQTYTSLGLGELTAATVFAGIAASGLIPVTSTRPGALALWSALAPVLLILAQAGVYWLMAREWAGRARMPTCVAGAYRAARLLDPLVLALGLIGIVAWFPSGADAALVLGVWVFAAAEYANYFVVRLAYPVHRWAAHVTQWRTPRLIKDLDRAR